MSHLEDLLCEYYEWRGCFVRRNVKVGRRPRGGWEGELDVVAFDPQSRELLHLEPSIDADSWSRREQRFAKKFEVARKYMFTEVVPWLDPRPNLRQFAILTSDGGGKRSQLAGAEVMTIDAFVAEIRSAVSARGIMGTAAISEQFPLLRTVQMFESGYWRRVTS